ncbi:MAG: hypothetical protein DBY10_05190 [Clostridiales bacterium]|jgi:uncharacterized protein YyaL (SSP411 family)|nr:MAG: hypothetical protein DBY10_05190 [Clostridiales bacterium]
MSNRLKTEASPYLQMHSENPVDWYPWGAEAFQRAREEEKPIFLSIGYSACHWCHVIARESFEDNEIAELLREDFISVKVDKEERPDVDAVYLLASQVFTGSAGWPTTVLATPEGKPFFAATYLPREQLAAVLLAAAHQWRSNREKVLAAADQAAERMEWYSVPQPVEPLAPEKMLELAVAQLQARYDPKWGGFGSAPKFPTPHSLAFLLRYGIQKGETEAWHMAVNTLEQMARGGIYDQIGGGFCRYSTDEQWLVPHFEKMLYDNAMLLWAYAEGWRQTRRPLFQAVAQETADYLLRELRGPQGGFYCSQDADSEGVEGGYYLYTPAEVRAVLGDEDGQTFCDWFDITEAGNFQGKNVPNLLKNPQFGQRDGTIDRLREQLRVSRSGRGPLSRDEKVVTSWNAMAIGALAAAGRILERPEYLAEAVRGQEFLDTHLVDPHGQLVHSCRGERMGYDGLLEDYAYEGWALLELFRATGEERYLRRAGALAQEMEGRFGDPAGGYYLYGAESEALVVRPKETYDGAVPSGNAMAALVLLRLSRYTGEDRWRQAAERQLQFLRAVPGETAFQFTFTCYVLAEAEAPGE